VFCLDLGLVPPLDATMTTMLAREGKIVFRALINTTSLQPASVQKYGRGVVAVGTLEENARLQRTVRLQTILIFTA
jgi:hypothetical protein